MKTKTIILLPLIAVVVAALAGCNQNNSGNSPAATNSAASQGMPSTYTSTNMPSTNTVANTNAPTSP